VRLREDRGWRRGSQSSASDSQASGPRSLTTDLESLRETEGIRALMGRGGGFFRAVYGRTDTVLQLDRCCADRREAMDRATSIATEWKRFNLLTVARLIAHAALRREESRGGG